MSDINYEIVKLVKKELNQKVWTFSEIANVSITVDEITEKIRQDIPTKEKVKMVWNVDVFAEELTPFGQIYSRVVNSTLKEQVAEIIKTELMDAKVSFKEEAHEISEGSLGGKSSKERKTDEEKPSDEQE